MRSLSSPTAHPTHQPFNEDVKVLGSYVYTQPNLFSARVANQRQSQEIIHLAKKYVGSHAHLLDLGCGDGTYSFELWKELRPETLTAFDVADQAIVVAQRKVPKTFRKQLRFQVGDIYHLDRTFPNQQFDVGIMRGLLHHLTDLPRAIEAVSHVLHTVIVLEPNGFNPILKVIEKTSPYHIQHGEKSYWPPYLNAVFKQHGYHVLEQRFVCTVPYFCPEPLARMLKRAEPFFEQLPIIHPLYTGTNVVVFQK